MRKVFLSLHKKDNIWVLKHKIKTFKVVCSTIFAAIKEDISWVYAQTSHNMLSSWKRHKKTVTVWQRTTSNDTIKGRSKNTKKSLCKE